MLLFRHFTHRYKLSQYPRVIYQQVINIDNTQFGTFEEWDNNTPLADDDVELPFMRDVELSAGSGSLSCEDFNGYKLRFSKNTLKQANVSIKDAVCVTAHGNSMEPVIPDGATVGIDTSSKEIRDGKVYAINHNGELRIKILFRLPGGGIRLKSYNREDWPDEEFDSDKAKEYIQVIGRMFWYSVLDY